MQEKELEKKFRKKVGEAGGKAYKFVSPGNSGVPDRLVVLPGGYVGFVELKQLGKSSTKLQQRQQSVLRSLGCYVTVLDNQEEMEHVISEIQKAGEKHGV